MVTYQKSFGMNSRERLQIDFSTFLTTSLVAQNDKQLKEIALRVTKRLRFSCLSLKTPSRAKSGTSSPNWAPTTEPMPP